MEKQCFILSYNLIMKLPNGKNAYISKEKLLEYLLSETHPVGKSKAKFFRKLGFNESNVDKLKQIFLSISRTYDVDDVKKTAYGVNYVIKGEIRLQNKSASIKTVWFIELGTDKPRFITAFPDIINKRR